MDDKKILELIKMYRRDFIRMKIKAIDFPNNDKPVHPINIFSHCCGMLDKMEEFILKDQRIEKAFRWLGFIQGCLWATGVYTLNDLKNHSRPDDPKEIEKN